MNEDAFEAAFYMVMPKDLDFKKIQQIGDKTDTPITCTAPSETNNYTLKCDIGNPLQSKKVANFKVVMLPSHKVGMAPSYDFFMEANSTNIEKPGSHFDNIIRKSISIWVETDLAIDGTSVPDFALYKACDYQSIENATKEEDLGPQVVHLYNIFNKGPSTIDEAIVFIHYPYQTAAGDYLMYMTNQPETHGNIQCDPHVNVNALNLQLDQNLVRKSYLEERGAVIRTHGVYESSSTSSSSSSSSSHSGVLIEKSHGQNQGGANVVSIGGGRQLSSEEKRRLEKEDEQAASGDASFVHSQRANAAAQANTQGSSGGRWSYSWNSTGSGSGPSIVVQTRNSSIVYDQRGQPHVVESSTEYVTSFDNIPRTYQHYPQASANYRQVGGAARQQQLQQQQGQVETEVGAHNARGHIQMAGPQGSAQHQRTYVGTPQRVQYFSSVATGGGYRPQQQQQQQQHRIGSAAIYNDVSAGAGAFEKAALGGRGFHTGTLDLGTLNRGNVEQELRNHGQPQGGSYSYHQTYSSGTPQSNANYHQMSSSSAANYGGGKPYYGLENEDYYDEDYNNQAGQQTVQKWSHSASSSQPLRRTRREQSDVVEPTQIDLNSPCKAAKCETLRCVARNLGKDDGVWIAIRTRMVAKTMEKLAGSVPLNVSTMAVSHVTKLPYIGEPKDDIIRSHEIFYKAVPEPTPVPDVVPLWVVVLAACAGALILLLLIFLLYKVCIFNEGNWPLVFFPILINYFLFQCGFFNRNRPADHSMERQPLRNGYHADEHL